MTRAELAKAVHERHGGISQSEAMDLVDTILEQLRQGFMRDTKVTISGFGSLKVLDRREKKGINPRTGQPMVIPEHRTVVLRPSRLLLATMDKR